MLDNDPSFIEEQIVMHGVKTALREVTARNGKKVIFLDVLCEGQPYTITVFNQNVQRYYLSLTSVENFHAKVTKTTYKDNSEFPRYILEELIPEE